ncbi:MAG: twin-arginine translocation signal domain-containing protein, partial [Verrucomicrobiales bacterium]
MKTRRQILKQTALGAAALAGGSNCIGAEENPKAGKTVPARRFKTGLAAYSFREQLPNYRAKNVPGETAMDMGGFLEH